MAYDNTNSGLLAKNDRKEKETHADYKGRINIDGHDYWLSAWIKVGKEGSKLAGQKYFSLAVQPMQETAEQSNHTPRSNRAPAPPPRRAAPAARNSGFDDMDSDVPF